MKVLITGSRTWNDVDALEQVLEAWAQQHPHMMLIHGACPQGADELADQWAKKNMHRLGAVITYPAKWDLYGKSAGFKRNKEMVDSKPDVVIAFIHNKSKGATMTVDLAQRAGIPVQIYRSNN